MTPESECSRLTGCVNCRICIADANLFKKRFLIANPPSFQGLNVLLELLYRTYENDKERVECKSAPFDGKEIYRDWSFWASPRKCSITFGDTLRLDYSLVSGQNHTDYPTGIQLYQRTDREWELRRQFKYLNFTTTFAEKQIVSAELPAGKECKRLESPKVEAQP